MIQELNTFNLGPVEAMNLTLAPRLNLLTGDNGLGKTFILDLLWFGLTGQWPQSVNQTLSSAGMARPARATHSAHIGVKIADGDKEYAPAATFDANLDVWEYYPNRTDQPTDIVFYAMVDGGFAIWDSMRNQRAGAKAGETETAAIVFNAKEVMDGLPDGAGGWLCEGLIKDWVLWQGNTFYQKHFTHFQEVLAALSALDTPMEPGTPRQVRPSDIRLIPTIRMPYGEEVPVTQASSGIKRITSLAYLLMWAWFGHQSAARARGKSPRRNITFLFDEAECHLHPRWQRSIIPALMKTAQLLSEEEQGQINIQFVVVTHSPLVMSSVEADFDPRKDKWFDLDCEDGVVKLTDRTYVAKGDAVNWLTSKAFDLHTTYALSVEKILNEATALLQDPNATRDSMQRMTEKLSTVLSDMDPYWIIWNAETKRREWR